MNYLSTDTMNSLHISFEDDNEEIKDVICLGIMFRYNLLFKKIKEKLCIYITH